MFMLVTSFPDLPSRLLSEFVHSTSPFCAVLEDIVQSSMHMSGEERC